jgi:FAD/FMN-containing dehydrogenase
VPGPEGAPHARVRAPHRGHISLELFQDASGFSGQADRRLVPENERELAQILTAASAQGIPVTIAGAWTGLTGGAVPLEGWLISMERFRGLEIAPGRAIAGAAVSLRDLQLACGPSRQFYAPDPTERTASVGGTIATNASGSRSFRYGSTRDHILALKAAFMDGSIRTFRRTDAIDFEVPPLPVPDTTKYTAGYPLHPGMDWIDLIAGSEGTLAVVIEAELRLLPAPQELLSGVVFFRDDAEALEAVEAWRPIDSLRMLEYFDGNSLKLLRTRYSEVPERAGAALLIEQEGSDIEPLEERIADDSWFAMSDQDRERFRQFRHALPEMVNDTMRRRGFLKLASDYAVPLNRNREMLDLYHDRLKGFDYVIFGHIGDAHVHVNLLPLSAEQFEAGKQVILDLAKHVVRLGGTVSAEHGLGKRKAHLLEIQYSGEHVAAMKAVKRRLDPQWLLGQGNLFVP